MSRDPVADLSLAELLAEVAARTPAPGGGAGAAWTCAMAAALTQMAASFSEGDRMAEVAARAEQLRSHALELADMDATAYGAVLTATGDARRVALSAAADPPLLMARAAAEVAALAAEVAKDGNQHLVGDAATAVHLAEAAAQAAANLVRINLAGSPDDARLADVATQTDAAASARTAHGGS